jgi:hypothetical protein
VSVAFGAPAAMAAVAVVISKAAANGMKMFFFMAIFSRLSVAP